MTFSLALSTVFGLTAFNAQTIDRTFNNITVREITLVDSAGHPRVLLAGGLLPRRADLAGILFFNQEVRTGT